MQVSAGGLVIAISASLLYLGLDPEQNCKSSAGQKQAINPVATSPAACRVPSTDGAFLLQSGYVRRRSLILYWVSVTFLAHSSLGVMMSWHYCMRRSRYNRAHSAGGRYSTRTGRYCQEPAWQ